MEHDPMKLPLMNNAIPGTPRRTSHWQKIKNSRNNFYHTLRKELELQGHNTLADILTSDFPLLRKVERIDEENKRVHLSEGIFGLNVLTTYYNLKGYSIVYSGAYISH